jgi:predicted RNA binding protein YcfA (HicA-like mRNA interferase family)
VGDVPVLDPREVARILERRGSHKQYRHPDGRVTTVPFHPGRDISPALLRAIARDIGMNVRDFVGLIGRASDVVGTGL